MIQSMSEIDFWAIPISFFWTEEDFKKSRYHLISSRSCKKWIIILMYKQYLHYMNEIERYLQYANEGERYCFMHSFKI